MNRDMRHPFGSPEYAKEELTAELSAALIASQHGLTKHVKNDSAAYLKSWLGSLQQNPEFLKTVLADVKHCTSMINERLGAIQLEMDRVRKRTTHSSDRLKGIPCIALEEGFAHSLFSDMAALEKESRLSESIDFIHKAFGRGAVFLGSQGSGEIKMSREHQSPHYTTLWSDIPKTSVR